MGYKLFLDDVREPAVCVHYMHLHIGKYNPLYLEQWEVVRNYQDFVRIVKEKGLPEIVSFDHDLAQEQYGMDLEYVSLEEYYLQEDREMTGYDCAKWLCNYCEENKLKFPMYFVHSMNPVGAKCIHKTIEQHIINRV